MQDISTVDVPPGQQVRKIPIVPLAGLPVVAVLIGFVIYAIASNSFWPLMFCHVAGGALWTSIDLFVGLAIGPIIGGMSPPARAEFSAKFMPKMVIIMPTVVTMTLATFIGLGIGLLARRRGTAAIVVLLCILVEGRAFGGRSLMVVEANRDAQARMERRQVTACLARDYDQMPILASMASIAPYMQETSLAGISLRQ